MARIVYLSFPDGRVQGGQKMIFRHVETLVEMGFDAVAWRPRTGAPMRFFRHHAPEEVGTPLRGDDVLVVPSDAANAISRLAARRKRVVVFEQNQFTSVPSYGAIDGVRDLTILTVGPTAAATSQRAFPTARIETVRCFADERLFRPLEKTPVVACSPRKRASEARIIRAYLERFHPRHALPWNEFTDVTEEQVAEVFGRATLCLSLSRFEAVGMTPLEAMASGCVVAGFLGVGGRDFATPDNGFWAPDDDCEAAADALAQAADLAATGGPALARYHEAARETARQWSYARFREELESVWMALAPEARKVAA